MAIQRSASKKKLYNKVEKKGEIQIASHRICAYNFYVLINHINPIVEKTMYNINNGHHNIYFDTSKFETIISHNLKINDFPKFSFAPSVFKRRNEFFFIYIKIRTL